MRFGIPPDQVLGLRTLPAPQTRHGDPNLALTDALDNLARLPRRSSLNILQERAQGAVEIGDVSRLVLRLGGDLDEACSGDFLRQRTRVGDGMNEIAFMADDERRDGDAGEIGLRDSRAVLGNGGEERGP